VESRGVLAPDGISATASSPAAALGRERSELRAAFAALRARLGLVALLFLLAGLAWWSTTDRMTGMDMGPGTDLGTAGWFLGIWVVMMAAMMFPSVSPTVALYSQMTRERGVARPLLFTVGYLLIWGSAGLLAFGLFELGSATLGDQLAWGSAGQWVVGGILVTAAVYELTPLKHVCLAHCRSPIGFLLSHWRNGALGAVRMGAAHGAWCFGCCWALMAALFAVGVMSVGWMAFVAALIALEKTLPWGRAVTWGTAAVLVVLAVTVLAAPDDLPGFVVPDGNGMMMDGGGMSMEGGGMGMEGGGMGMEGDGTGMEGRGMSTEGGGMSSGHGGMKMPMEGMP
jgi:predicted metal-binding membrane protein